MKKFLYLFTLSLLGLHGLSVGARTIALSEDVELHALRENIFLHVSYRMTEEYGRVPANGLLFLDGKEAILLDSPWTNKQTRILLAYVRDSLELEIIAFVPNHFHEDCMGGLEAIHGEGIPSFASELTQIRAREHGLPLPQNSFRDSLELTVGNEKVLCIYPGAAHSTDNIAVWIPSEKVLFPACTVKSLNSRNLGNTADGDLEAYPRTLKKLKSRFPDASLVVPGHGRPAGLELIDHTLTLASPG